ncbi:MAG: hypothetical protein NTW60_01905, partial [Candidatus Wolfebacteria bacterium]|nr:hypothetical protein [Candidatus Wolfebacteria bacterium]
LLGLGLFSFVSILRAQDLEFKPYSADVIITTTQINGTITTTEKLYIAKDKSRTETLKSGKPASILIVRYDKGVKWNFFPSTRIYRECPVGQSNTSNSPKGRFVGTETIDGQLADRYDERLGVDCYDSYYYIHGTASPLKYVLKVMPAGKVTWQQVTEFKNIKFGEPYSELFEMPAGYKLVIDELAKKPVLYLYPAHQQQVSVRLEYQGSVIVSYPKYNESLKGWDVTAYPDGRIINSSDQEEYSYIFWEGVSDKPVQYDFSKGFVVEGEKTAVFLRDTLRKIGLTPKEYNEFIVYWYPKLKDNKYNLIHFAQEEYEKVAHLEISPKPDSILRVFMVYKPFDKKVDVAPQEIKPFVRSGFTVVEWGGREYN